MRISLLILLIIANSSLLFFSCTRQCDCSELHEDNGLMKDGRNIVYTGE